MCRPVLQLPVLSWHRMSKPHRLRRKVVSTHRLEGLDDEESRGILPPIEMTRIRSRSLQWIQIPCRKSGQKSHKLRRQGRVCCSLRWHHQNHQAHRPLDYHSVLFRIAIEGSRGRLILVGEPTNQGRSLREYHHHHHHHHRCCCVGSPQRPIPFD